MVLTQGKNNLSRHIEYKEIAVPDKKDSRGNWLKCYSQNDLSGQFMFRTRAGRLWKSLNSRCRKGSTHQVDSPCYISSKNEFKGFQEFADWCQTQIGYMSKDENGKFWSLDKDICSGLDCKVYSEVTCAFVPERINNLILRDRSDKGDNPIGVDYHKGSGKYRATCGTRHLGLYTCPMTAHRAWQVAKIEVLKGALISLSVDERVSNGIKLITDSIFSDYKYGNETIL